MCDSLRGGVGALSGAAMMTSSAESMGMNSLDSSDSGEHSFLGIFFASSVFATFTSLVPCLLGLFVAFCAVCNICEQRLVPAVEIFIKEYHIPEELAAVTLIAFGSASPELLLNTVSAIEKSSDLSLPAILGSAIIAFGFIPALVFLCGKKNETQLRTWPIIRETSFYLLGLYIFLRALLDGKLYAVECLGLIGVYLMYVCTVAVVYFYFPNNDTDSNLEVSSQSASYDLSVLSSSSNISDEYYSSSSSSSAASIDNYSIENGIGSNYSIRQSTTINDNNNSNNNNSNDSSSRSSSLTSSSRQEEEQSKLTLALSSSLSNNMNSSCSSSSSNNRYNESPTKLVKRNSGSPSSISPSSSSISLNKLLTDTSQSASSSIYASSTASFIGDANNNGFIMKITNCIVWLIDASVEIILSLGTYTFFKLIDCFKLLFHAVSQPIELIVNAVFPDLHPPSSTTTAERPTSSSLSIPSAATGSTGSADVDNGSCDSRSISSTLTATPPVRLMSSGIIRPSINVFLSIACIGICSVIIVHICEIIVDNMCVEKSTVGATLLAFGSEIPDIVSSVTLARSGYGDAAIAGAIGSQVINICISVGLPSLLLCLSLPGGFIQISLEQNKSLWILIWLTFMIITVYFNVTVLLPAISSYACRDKGVSSRQMELNEIRLMNAYGEGGASNNSPCSNLSDARDTKNDNNHNSSSISSSSSSSSSSSNRQPSTLIVRLISKIPHKTTTNRFGGFILLITFIGVYAYILTDS